MGDEKLEEMMQALAAAMQVVEQQQDIISDQKDHITTLINQQNAVTKTALDVGSQLRKTAARSPSLTLGLHLDETQIEFRCSYEMLEDEDVRAILQSGRAIVETLRQREDTRSASVDSIRKAMEDTRVLKQFLATFREALPDDPDTDANSTEPPGGTESADPRYAR